MEMMRAVLDSNFWLATHVVTITIGYSTTFLAGFLGIAYVFSLLVRFLFKRENDGRELNSKLLSMIFGVTCFSLFFSLVGTVLFSIPPPKPSPGLVCPDATQYCANQTEKQGKAGDTKDHRKQFTVQFFAIAFAFEKSTDEQGKHISNP